MNTSTEYMNGGVTSNLVKLFAAGGYKPTADELLTIAAHDAMPRNGQVYMPWLCMAYTRSCTA